MVDLLPSFIGISSNKLPPGDLDKTVETLSLLPVAVPLKFASTDSFPTGQIPLADPPGRVSAVAPRPSSEGDKGVLI